MGKTKVYFEKLRDDVKLPTYANEGDAGMDVYCPEEIKFSPGDTKVVPLGFKVAIPEGYELQVRPRSGMSLKTPFRVANSPGTIDSQYRGEVGVILDHRGSELGLSIAKGDRIAQLVLKEVEQCEWEVVDSVDSIGSDRGGGFGSTGK